MGLDSRVVWGGLVLAALGTGAYLLFKEKPRTDPGVPVTGGPATLEAHSVASGALVISGEPGSVIAGSVGHQASVLREEGATYTWTIIGGILEGATHLDAVTWTAGEQREVQLSCKIVRRDGTEATGSLRVPVLRPPVISRFSATPATIRKGGAAQLTWACQNVKSLVLNPGGQEMIDFQGPTFEVKPTETTTYTIMATSLDGLSASSETTVKVVEDPQILSFKADPVGTNGYAITAEFKGGKAEIKSGGAVLASGETSPLRIEMADVKVGSSVTVTVSSEAGSSVSNSIQFSAKK